MARVCYIKRQNFRKFCGTAITAIEARKVDIEPRESSCCKCGKLSIGVQGFELRAGFGIQLSDSSIANYARAGSWLVGLQDLKTASADWHNHAKHQALAKGVCVCINSIVETCQHDCFEALLKNQSAACCLLAPALCDTARHLPQRLHLADMLLEKRVPLSDDSLRATK